MISILVVVEGNAAVLFLKFVFLVSSFAHSSNEYILEVPKTFEKKDVFVTLLAVICPTGRLGRLSCKWLESNVPCWLLYHSQGSGSSGP